MYIVVENLYIVLKNNTRFIKAVPEMHKKIHKEL